MYAVDEGTATSWQGKIKTSSVCLPIAFEQPYARRRNAAAASTSPHEPYRLYSPSRIQSFYACWLALFNPLLYRNYMVTGTRFAFTLSP